MPEIRVSVQKRPVSWTTADGKKQKSFVWCARWRSVEGRDVVKSLKTKDKREAERMRDEIEKGLAVKGAAKASPARLDWKRAWALYESLMPPSSDVESMRTKRYGWELFWHWAEAGSEVWPSVGCLDEVTRGQAMAWRNFLGTGRERPLAGATINKAASACASVYNLLAEAELYTGGFPFARMKALDEEETERDHLTLAEIDVYLERAKEISDDLYVYAALAIFTGMRAPSEVLAARWSWLHWSADGASGYLKIPKTDEGFKVKDKASRTIPLASRLIEILRPRRGIGKAFIVAPHCALRATQNLEQPRSEQREYARWSGYQQYRRLSKCIPGKHITSYSFRWTFASILMAQGISLFKGMEWMGHSDVRMLQRYAHLAPMDQEINRVFPPVVEAQGEK